MYIQPDYPPHSEMQKSRFKFFRVAPPALKNPWRSTYTCAPDTNCGLSCMPSCGKTYPTLVRFAKRLNCRKFPAVLFFKNHLNFPYITKPTRVYSLLILFSFHVTVIFWGKCVDLESIYLHERWFSPDFHAWKIGFGFLDPTYAKKITPRLTTVGRFRTSVT